MVQEITLARLSIVLLFAFITQDVFSQIHTIKDVTYVDHASSEFKKDSHVLDVYYPKGTVEKKDVLIFIHGGSWSSGKKETYRFLGRKLARKGIVAVIVNYRLAPSVRYEKMAEDCARATYWVYKNISQYGGNPQNITLSGHSAGGHLAALIALDSTFKKLGATNPIHKVALIDAFGLDMKTYFEEYNNDYARSLFKVFPSEQKNLEAASPQYYIKPGIKIPFLILTGSRTYPAIIKSSIAFDSKIRECGGVSEYHVIPGKKHIGMMSQLLFSKNKVYDILLDFMKGS